MIQRRGFFGRLAALVGIFSLPAQTGTASERSARKDDKPKAPLVIDLHADRKHFQQYEVFDADACESVSFAIFYADEGSGIIRFWTPLGGRLEAYLKQDRDRGGKFEITGHGSRIFEKSSSMAWTEMRRRIKILKRLTPEQRFEAQAAIT